MSTVKYIVVGEGLPWRVRLWRGVFRFAFRRMRLITPKMPLGVPHNRDPEHPCDAYEPRPRELGDWGSCQTDGHYLCNECAHRAEPERDDEEGFPLVVLR